MFEKKKKKMFWIFADSVLVLHGLCEMAWDDGSVSFWGKQWEPSVPSATLQKTND